MGSCRRMPGVVLEFTGVNYEKIPNLHESVKALNEKSPFNKSEVKVQLLKLKSMGGNYFVRIFVPYGVGFQYDNGFTHISSSVVLALFEAVGEFQPNK